MVCVPHALQVLEGQTPLPPTWNDDAAHLDQGLPNTTRTDRLLAEDHAHRQGHPPGHRAVRGGVFRRDVSGPESML